MTSTSQPTPYGVHLVTELHDLTPERHIHSFAAPLDEAAIGDLVGIRIAGAFAPEFSAITPVSVTCLVRTDEGIAEVPFDELVDGTRQPVARYLRVQEDHWGWLEAVDMHEPLRAQLCPANTGIDVLMLRDAIAVITRTTAVLRPLANVGALPGTVAGLFVQHPNTARLGKVTRRTVEILAEIFSAITGLPADQALLAETCDQVDARPSATHANPMEAAASGWTETSFFCGSDRAHILSGRTPIPSDLSRNSDTALVHGQSKGNTMSQTYSPTLVSFTEACKAPGAITDACVINDGESEAVRLVINVDDLELVFYSHVEIVPGSNAFHIDPYLIDSSRQDLVNHGVLPTDAADAMALGSGLVLEIATAHRDRIIETIRGDRIA